MRDYRFLPKGPVQQLVIMLHGVGADGQDLIGLASVLAPLLPSCAFIAPDGPEPYDMAPFGRQWFSLRDRSESVLRAGLEKTAPVLDTYLDERLKEFSLPAARVALLGFSQGTMMTLYTGLRRREAFAGLLGYSGALLGLPPKEGPRPPICLVHGEDDAVVPAAASRMAAEFLEKEKYPTTLHLLPGLGHGLDERGLEIGAAFLKRVLSRNPA